MKSKLRIGNEWKTCLKLPFNRDYYAMVAIGNERIAIVGGEEDGTIVDLVDVYHLKSKNWSSFKMKEKRDDCAAVVIDEKLFVFGGLGNGDFLSSCEMHDLCDPSHKSHILSPLSEAKYGLAAVVYDNTNVVVLGGWNGEQRLATACMFDTINKRWIELPSMPTPRYDLAAGVSGSYIIAAGGEHGHKVVEILDMQTRRWKRVANMQRARSDHGGAVIGHSASSFHMVVAGSYGKKHQLSCEMYSFQNDSWSALPDLKSKSYFRRLIVMDGMLVAGGEKGLETLDLSTPELIYELVHFVVGLNVFSSSCMRK